MKLSDLSGFASLDWGFNDPFVCLWWVCLPDGRYHIQREWKDDHVYVEDFCAQFWKISFMDLGWTRRQVRYVVVGGDTKAKHGLRSAHGESVQETMRSVKAHHLPVRDADRDRKNGWYRVHELLRPTPWGPPWLSVDPRCTYLRRTIPAAPSDPHDPDDIDEVAFTQVHGLESLRYGAMSRPSPTRLAAKPTYDVGTHGWWNQSYYDRPKPGGVLA